MEFETICLGAGPAGLTAAYTLAKAGKTVLVLEVDPKYVGGISRTMEYKGFKFDIGGHRFFSKSQEINDLWDELLPAGMLIRPRMSRIYFDGKFFHYPLKPANALFQLGIFQTALCILSYLRWTIFPIKNVKTFEQWICNEFGERLYKTFFKTYTEKVWGIPCDQISANWASQRIKGLSLGSAIASALTPKWLKGTSGAKSLIEAFKYPRFGPGMLWESAADKVRALGGGVHLGCRVTSVEKLSDGYRVGYIYNGEKHSVTGHNVISSLPITELMGMLSPSPSVSRIANQLKYRDFLTVALILEDAEEFPDNWIYIHDPKVSVGRIQNFRSWSPDMLPDAYKSCYGLEFFCNYGDSRWNMSNEDLIELASNELREIGLLKRGRIVDGCVIRQPKAYPVYDDTYEEVVDKIRTTLSESFPGLYLVGRNGMHKYNNQDHSMMTALLTARNIISGESLYDVWNVNQDAEYHEGSGSSSVSGERYVPKRVA